MRWSSWIFLALCFRTVSREWLLVNAWCLCGFFFSCVIFVPCYMCSYCYTKRLQKINAPFITECNEQITNNEVLKLETSEELSSQAEMTRLFLCLEKHWRKVCLEKKCRQGFLFWTLFQQKVQSVLGAVAFSCRATRNVSVDSTEPCWAVGREPGRAHSSLIPSHPPTLLLVDGEWVGEGASL